MYCAGTLEYSPSLSLQPPPPEEKVNLHFLALVCKEGCLYELGENTCV